MIRWIRAHPYTTATPFLLGVIIVLGHFALGMTWGRAAAFICLIALVPVVVRVCDQASKLK